jgi:HAMP domain-containing protein
MTMSEEPIHVYLVPVGGGEYELYCEPAGRDDDRLDDGPGGGGKRSFWRRQVDRFKETLAEAEAERLRQERGEEVERRGIGRWVIRKIAEAIAEQRLLWHLRHADRVLLIHPDDVPGDEAERIARAHLAADYRKHRNWCVIDGVLAAITGPLFFFVPGPNIIGWYFLFRAVGHLFALRGARQGLTAARWQTDASSPLAGLRHALDLDSAERRRRVEAISETLGLNHLVSFVERVAARTS